MGRQVRHANACFVTNNPPVCAPIHQYFFLQRVAQVGLSDAVEHLGEVLTCLETCHGQVVEQTVAARCPMVCSAPGCSAGSLSGSFVRMSNVVMVSPPTLSLRETYIPRSGFSWLTVKLGIFSLFFCLFLYPVLPPWRRGVGFTSPDSPEKPS